MLVQRLWRCPNIKPALAYRQVFNGMVYLVDIAQLYPGYSFPEIISTKQLITRCPHFIKYNHAAT